GRRGRLAQRTRVVLEVRAIGGADLDQPRAALSHYLGDPEAPADLDELAARDDGVAAVGERVERENECRGAIVDHDRVAGAGELAQQRRTVHIPRAAAAAVDVVLDLREAARHAR